MYQICSWRNAGLGTVVLAFVVATGCAPTLVTSGDQGGAGGAGGASSSSSSSGEAGMGGAGGGIGGTGGVGGGIGGSGGSGGILPACPSGSPAVFAVDKILLGDIDSDGTPNPTNGWKNFGFNLDGRISTKMSTDLCKPVAGGSAAAVYPDGTNGIDNAFGKNILPILMGLNPDFSVQYNTAITSGNLTYLFSLENAGQDLCTTSSAFFLGDVLGKMPKFDGSDVWPINRVSLLDPAVPTSAKCSFANTRIEMGVVRTDVASEFSFAFSFFAGLPNGVVPIRNVRTTFELAPDGKSAISGQIGGIIRTEEFVQAIAKDAPYIDTSFCDPQSPTLMSILNIIRQASDIMQDGTQDPTKVCDGISIGLGFTMKPAQLGAVAPVAPPPPDPCGP